MSLLRTVRHGHRVMRGAGVRAPHFLELVEQLQTHEKAPELLQLGKAFANVLSPGAGDHLEKVVRVGGKLLLGNSPAVAYMAAEDQPWNDFLTHYSALPWGVVCIYGDPGQGKSEFAKKSLAIWRERDGWPVEFVNWYAKDLPDFGYEIDGQRVIARIRKIGKFLNQRKGVFVDDGLTDEDLAGRRRAATPSTTSLIVPRTISQEEIDRLGYRNVCVDEAGLFFSDLGDVGQQSSREASKRWSDQIRHLNTRMLFIAQKIGDVPPHVRSSALNVYKWASPGVVEEDYRPGQKRVMREKWDEALMAIRAVMTGKYPEPLPKWLNDVQRDAIRQAARAHVYYVDEFAHPQAWGYGVGTLGGHAIRTIFPFEQYQPMAA